MNYWLSHYDKDKQSALAEELAKSLYLQRDKVAADPFFILKERKRIGADSEAIRVLLDSSKDGTIQAVMVEIGNLTITVQEEFGYIAINYHFNLVS